MSAKLLTIKYPIIVVNAQRTERKTYMTHAVLKEALAKANEYGCQGQALFNDADGSEICDDEILEFLLTRKTIFMVCDYYTEWTPRNNDISHEEKKMETEKITHSKILTKQSKTENNVLCRKKQTTPVENNQVKSYKCVCKSQRKCNCLRIFDSNEDCPYPEFENFTIPWKKVPLDIMELLETEQLLLRNVNPLANLLVDEMLLRKPKLPIEIMRRVAERTVSRYPNSFLNSNESNSLSNLIGFFLSILRNRYFNLLRGIIRKGLRKSKERRVETESERSNDECLDLEDNSLNDQNSNGFSFSEIAENNIEVKIEYDYVSENE